ncbi:MAG: glycerol-3-phosphate acyltransferase [Eubacterium sp.]|nr:glycerol-3-phosphate acyltransferase [Eubacterium sp.]
MVRIICVLIGYAFGLFQTSYILGKRQGIDIRSVGSGNAGTTNALRILGMKAGTITAACDVGKCILAVIITWAIFHNTYAEIVPLLKIWTAAGVVLGHIFPFYMNFRGGKGIAVMGGMIIAFGDIRLIIIGIIVFFGMLFLTNYASVASLSLITSFSIEVAIGNILGAYGMAPARRVELLVVVLCLTALAWYQHRENVLRLLQGNERRTDLLKKLGLKKETKSSFRHGE